ncbi:MAG: hypothetical protein ACP5FH_07760 [Terracidiphilus sp.]
MATLQTTFQPESFRVVHPLHDAPEQKCSTENLGPIAMTPAVRISLAVLRGYLVFMTLMLSYHVLGLAGILRQ